MLRSALTVARYPVPTMLVAPPLVALSPRERLVRFALRRCMKDKHLRALARRYWPPMRVAVEGHRFELHPADNATEFRLFAERLLGERASLAALCERVAGRRALVFDIGANCGAYAVPLAAAAGEGSRLHAFEPSPTMAARLARNLALNGLEHTATIHRVALARGRGRATLNLHARNHGQSSLRPIERRGGTLEVECRPLADFVPPDAAGYERFVIKIDVEGGEDAALGPYLASAPDAGLPDAILLETAHAESWREDLGGALGGRGYRVVLEADGNALYARDDG